MGLDCWLRAWCPVPEVPPLLYLAACRLLLTEGISATVPLAGAGPAGDALFGMELSLSLERLNFEKLLHLWDACEKHGDPQLTQYVEDMMQVWVGGCRGRVKDVLQLVHS